MLFYSGYISSLARGTVNAHYLVAPIYCGCQICFVDELDVLNMRPPSLASQTIAIDGGFGLMPI